MRMCETRASLSSHFFSLGTRSSFCKQPVFRLLPSGSTSRLNTGTVYLADHLWLGEGRVAVRCKQWRQGENEENC